MRLAYGSKARVNPFPAWRDLKVHYRSAQLAHSDPSLPRDWHANEPQGPPRQGRRAPACHPTDPGSSSHPSAGNPARDPIGRNRPMRISTGHERCPTYSPRVSIEEAPARGCSRANVAQRSPGILIAPAPERQTVRCPMTRHPDGARYASRSGCSPRLKWRV